MSDTKEGNPGGGGGALLVLGVGMTVVRAVCVGGDVAEGGIRLVRRGRGRRAQARGP
jgi:hypothetical protein